jgi:hypothetical protein
MVMFNMIEMWNEPSHIKYTRILEVIKQIINTPFIKLDSNSTLVMLIIVVTMLRV